MLALLAGAITTSCQLGPGVERIALGDTVIVRTPPDVAVDTASLEIIERYPLPRAPNDTMRTRVATFAFDEVGDVRIVTTDGTGYLLMRDGRIERSQSDVGGENAAADPPPIPARFDDCGQAPDPHYRSGRFADIRHRYTASLQWARLASGAVAIGCNDEYAFDIVDAAGRVTRIELDRDGVPVSREERTSFIAAWTLRLRGLEFGPDWSWTADTLPNQKPAYQRIISGSDGGVWVWPSQPSVTLPAPPQWHLIGGPKTLWVEPSTGAFDVFADDGTFVGVVLVSGAIGFAPFGTTPPPLVRADTAWWIIADSTGSHAVVRTHVRWHRRGGAHDHPHADGVHTSSRARSRSLLDAVVVRTDASHAIGTTPLPRPVARNERRLVDCAPAPIAAEIHDRTPTCRNVDIAMLRGLRASVAAR